MSQILIQKNPIAAGGPQAGISRLILNRPDVHNAFNAALIQDIHHAINDLSRDPDTRVIILSGAGKSFSAGADLNWMQQAAQQSESENEADAERLSAMLAAVAHSPCPIVTIAHGAAMGGALGLLAGSDIVIASFETRFAFSEVKLGLIPATIAPFVIEAIGARQARRYFVTGERFDSSSALKMGLIHECAPDFASAEKTAFKIASEIAQNAPLAVRHSKKLVRDFSGKPINGLLRQDSAQRIAVQRTTPEAREGIGAFFEKRSPQWPAPDLRLYHEEAPE